MNQHWGTRNPVAATQLQFKPRFILKSRGKLELIPAPLPAFEEIQEIQRNPAEFLKHEYYLPGSDYGNQYLAFPYTLALVKTLFFHTKLRSLFKGEPPQATFYTELHPFKALQITAAIMEAFDTKARSDK
ncbi:MAG: hypothetical protein JKX73_08270 [Flavobacteriales bacterium]|nr:hypothetical protein [Flavobacteriales bacterium]